MSGRHIALMAGVALGIAPFASASIFELQLSTHSSDETPAADLLATFEFSVVGFTLTLTVTNDTFAPNEFNMNEVYFNGQLIGSAGSFGPRYKSGLGSADRYALPARIVRFAEPNTVAVVQVRWATLAALVSTQRRILAAWATLGC